MLFGHAVMSKFIDIFEVKLHLSHSLNTVTVVNEIFKRSLVKSLKRFNLLSIASLQSLTSDVKCHNLSKTGNR